MRKDPFIRHPHDPAPLIPYKRIRYAWPGEYDPDVDALRERMQESGPGLYIMCLPRERKAVVECYYPEDIRPGFYDNNLDPARRADVSLGRLVAVNQVMTIPRGGVLSVIAELRRNNRQSRQKFRRTHSKSDHRINLLNTMDENEREIFDSFSDAYVDAVLETRATAKPGSHRKGNRA